MAIETLQTLSYSDGSKGWPSFYTYYPDYMIGMNSFFYSFKGGNLYRHNTNTLRNNYYGVQGSSSITGVFNPKPTLDIKLFKTMSLESDASWTATNIKTDLNSGSMLNTYFEQKEGEWYSYIRSKYQNAKKYHNNFDYILLNKIASPCEEKSIYNILEEIDRETILGKNLVLYEKYQRFFGDDGLSSNIIIPSIDYQLQKTIRELVIINNS